MIFSVFLIFFLIFYGKFVEGFGPRDWIQKLTFDEQDKIFDACNYNLTWPDESTKKFDYYVAYGNTVNKSNEFPFAAALVKRENDEAFCAATFITQRHLFTARHCFSENTNMKLMVGGVCHTKHLPDCPEVDMVELEFDFVIFSNLLDVHGYLDFAIIQLKKPIPTELRGRVEFVCIAEPLSKMPQTVRGIGWGMTENNNTQHTRLRVAEMSTYPTEQNFPEVCDEVFPRMFCAFPLPNTTFPYQPRTYYGDSGGAVLETTKNEITGRYVMFGMTVKGDLRKINNINQTFITPISLRMEIYWSDLCYYLGYCLPNVDTDYYSVGLGSVYLYGRRATYLPIAPLKPWTTLENENHVKYCKKKKRAMTKPNFNGTLEDVPQFSFAASLIDMELQQRIICGATFVTTRHLITSKDCIVYWLKTRYMPTIRVSAGGLCNVVNKEIGCSAVDTKQFNIEFITWKYSHTKADAIAIIQLEKDLKEYPKLELKQFQPVCFYNADRIPLKNPLYSYTFNYNNTAQFKVANLTVDPNCETEICTFAKEKNTKFFSESYWGGGIGNALLETRFGGQMIGLLDSDTDNKGHYAKTYYWLDALCLMVNRCFDKNQKYLMSPDFDTIYFVKEPKRLIHTQ